MTYEENFDSVAGIHFKNLSETDPNSYGNNRLTHELGKLGLGTILIPNASAYDADNKIIIGYPAICSGDGELLLEEPKGFSYGDDSALKVIRARVLTHSEIEKDIHILNGEKLRAIGASKWEQYKLASEFMPKTILIEPDVEPNSVDFDVINGTEVVLKADASQASKFMKIVPKSEAPSTVNAIRTEFFEKEFLSGSKKKNKRIIAQEYVAGLPWSELTPVNDHSKDLLASGNNTEVRVYCYVDRNGIVPFEKRFYATARVFDSAGKDDWASVDQDSVPSAAWNIAETVSKRLLDKADCAGGYLAVDLIMGDALDGLGKRMFIREINTRDPMMVGKGDNLEDYVNQRKLLANVMATVAKAH